MGISAKIDSISNNHKLSTIQKFYEGQTILITGATGFLGKVLLEKLLRCLNLKKIYLLVRPKKHKTSEERFKDIFDDDLFGKLKEDKPDAFKKVVLIDGDIQLEDNGISPSDKEMLIKEVTCIFHSAATVNFQEPLKTAVYLNVRSVRDLLYMAKKMQNLKAFIHVSTAFSNCIREDVDEKFYPPPVDSDNLLQIMELVDDNVIDAITPGLLNEWPNSYVFTKGIGEDIVRKNAKHLPVGIFRPGIVLPTYKEPVSGWANSVIGFCGLVIANALGVLRVIHADINKRTEIVPADFVVNCLVASAWEVGTEVKDEKDSVKIYNYVASTFENFAITWERFINICNDFYYNLAPSQMIWYPILILTKNFYFYVLLHYIFHIAPGYILDKLLVMINQKPLLLKTYEKIHKVQKALGYFSVREWNFKSNNVHNLYKKLDDQDKQIFNFDLSNRNWTDMLETIISGGRQYIMKESPDTVAKGQRKFLIFKACHYFLVTVFCLAIIAFLWKILAWSNRI